MTDLTNNLTAEAAALVSLLEGRTVLVKPSEIIEELHTDLLIGIARNRVALAVIDAGPRSTLCADAEGRHFLLRNSMLSSEVA